ncbi:hypothetical protein SFRURICE_019454, partial [Spodoptera frugiperda]
ILIIVCYILCHIHLKANALYKATAYFKQAQVDNSSVMLCPTRESNSRPLARQSHLRPLDQRGSRRLD